MLSIPGLIVAGLLLTAVLLLLLLLLAYRFEQRLYCSRRNRAMQKIRELQGELSALEHVLTRQNFGGERVIAAFRRLRMAVSTIESRAEFIDRMRDFRLGKPEGAYWPQLGAAASDLRRHIEELRFFSEISCVVPCSWPFVESDRAIYVQAEYQSVQRRLFQVPGAGALDYDLLPVPGSAPVSVKRTSAVVLHISARAKPRSDARAQQATQAYARSAEILPFRKGSRIDVRA